MEKNARNIILFRCSKAFYFHTFSKMFLSKFTLKNIYNTPQICSGVIGSDVPWLECPACNALTSVITVTE